MVNTIINKMTNSFAEQSLVKSTNAINNNDNEKDRVVKAAKEFESYMISYMMKEMRKSVPDGGILPKNDGEKIFQEMQDQNYAKIMADKGGLGLSRIMIERWRKNMTGVNGNPEI